jgi:hypothetical protein
MTFYVNAYSWYPVHTNSNCLMPIADLREFLLESRYHSAPELPLPYPHFPANAADTWGNDASARGAISPGDHQRIPRPIRTADVAGSPGLARSGSEARPGIIRAHSQDFTIE